MLKISRESEINLINVLIDHDIISGKDLPNIKKVSTEKNKSQIDAVFELKLTDENKILDVLVKEQNLEVVDLSKVQITDDIKTVLPSNYINMNFVAPFKMDSKVLHIAISDSSKLGLMRNLKAITKKNIELHAAKVSQISEFIEKILSEKTIVYKGQLTTWQLRPYFPDLHDVRCKSAIALVHSRFSTNTVPKWKLGQPFRRIAHSGEINTV